MISERVEEKIKEKNIDLEEWMKSLEYEKDCLTDRLAKVENSLIAQKDRLEECEKDALASAQRSNYNEQYSRKNNVKLLNIPERASETEQTLTEQVSTILLSKGNIDCASVYMCFVVTCWERADLLALVCGVFCEFVTFPLVSWVRCGT